MQILVAKEKYADRYFAAPDKDTLGRIALKLLRERFNENWFASLAEVEREKRSALNRITLGSFDKEILDYTPEQIDALPEKLKASVEKARADYELAVKRVERDYAEELGFARDLEAIISDPEPDLRLAWQLFDSRSDAEYEGYTLERAEEV
jgi:adenylate cyclase class IV